jgi:hypothetical protein
MATRQVMGRGLRAAAELAAWLVNSRNNFWAVDRTAHRVGSPHRAITITTTTAVVTATTTTTMATTIIAAVAVVEGLEALGTWRVAF